MAAADTARLVAELTLKDKLTAGVKSAIGSIHNLESSVGRIGKGTGQLAGGLARVGAIAAGATAAGLGFAAKQAIDFEDAFAGVRKTVDETDLAKAGLSFDSLAKSFRNMATEIPIAATDFARIGEAAGALGIKATDIETFTKTVALLGVTTNLTSDEAAESLGKIGTILGLTGKDFTAFGDALVNLGNKGASTESEIIEVTKRFGAAGKQAGLSTDQILGFSSAIASAGVEPEAAGSSLSRLFNNIIAETATASKQGKAFAKVTGKSFKDFSKIVEEDSVGAVLLFLDSLRKLDKFDQSRALEAVGITDVRQRNAVQLLASTYDQNLIPALENAKNSTGALSTEATKRFDTIRSKLQLLKQNFIEAAITVGEGFTPALGRAADKLIAFLKVDANKSALRDLGKDIGDAIDKIDWKEVLDGAKTFLEVMKTIASVVLSIPNEIKAAGLALIGLNKLSGGLFGAGAGNIVGGLAGAVTKGIAAKIPGVGSLFAQPVYVVNMPAGGLGGGVPGAAGGAAAGGFFAPGLAAALVAFTVPIIMFDILPKLLSKPGGNDALPIKTPGGGEITGPNAGIVRLFTPALGKEPIKADVIKAPPLALSPDDRQILNDQKAHINETNQRLEDLKLLRNPRPPQGMSPDEREALRAQKSAVDRTNEKLEAVRAQTAAAASATSRSVDAIERLRNQRRQPINVNAYFQVRITQRDSVYQSTQSSKLGFAAS